MTSCWPWASRRCVISIAVRCSNYKVVISLWCACCPNTYATTMSTTALWKCSGNTWNGAVLALDKQQVRSYWCVLALNWSCYSCSIQYDIVNSPWCAVQITTMAISVLCVCSLNVWNGVVLELGKQKVRSMYWYVLEFEAFICARCTPRSLVILTRFAVQIHCNVDDNSSGFMIMTRGHFCAGQTGRTFILAIGVRLNLKMLFVFDRAWGRNRTLLCCLHNYNGDDCCVCLCSLNIWNGIVLALHEQKVRVYWYGLGFGVCSIQYEAVVWPWCAVQANTLQWRWRNDGCVFMLCWLNVWNGVVLALDEQHVSVYWCVLTFDVVTRVRWGNNFTLARLWSWNGVTLALDEQLVCLHWYVNEFQAALFWYRYEVIILL